MKKLLLFVIACTLGLFGTVSAQTTVTIGTGTESGYAIADNYDGHGASQQIYTAAEIGSAGTITSIAFQKANGSDYDRTWSIYMKHIDEENFTGNLNYIMTADELVYEGTFTTTNDWIVFNIDPFQYDGEHNLIVTVVDNSGVYGGDQNWYYTSIPFDNGSKCLSKYFTADIDITQQIAFSAFAGRFNIQLTFAAAGEGGEEPTPEPKPEQPNDGYQDIIAEVGANMNPSASNNYNIPAYDYNAYSVSQQIYLAEELCGMVGEINSVSFKFGVYTRQPITRQYEVYLTHTDLEVFNEYNFVAVSESDKVFDGDVYLEGTADTWFTIEFDKAFNYEGGNFILTVYDKSGVSAGNDYHYFYRYLTTKRALLWKNGPYDIYNMTGTGSSMAYVNQLQLGMTVSTTPTVPQNLVAVATGASTIALSWNTVGVATSYNVYSNGQLLANVEGTTYTVEGLTADTEYCYTVAAVNGELVSDASTAACAKTTAPAPSAPTGLVATADVTTVALSWNAAETAVSYNIYKGTDVIATAVTETTYNVQDLTPETEYCFTVTAVNAGGESAASEAVCATTLEFTGCYVIFTLKDSYGDGWYQDKMVVSYDGITKDLVFTENSNAKTKEYVLGIPQDAHVTVVYQAGVQYSYPAEESIVIAYESGREIYSLATLSNGCNFEFDVNCAPAVPDQPVVVAKATGESTIELTVTAVGADSYTIYQGTEVLAVGLTTATYTVEGLTADTEYCFTVKSTNEVGESEVSEAACAKTYKAGSAIVQIGDETSALYGYYAPVSNMGYYANYSLSQQIYLKEELGGEPCAITSVSFQNYSGGPNTRNIVVYMTNVDDAKDTFEGGAGDWVVVSEADIVYQGQHTFGVQGDWTTIEFETPFIYRGKNVCITVNDLTGITKNYSGYDMFYVTATENIRGIYATNQTSQFDCSNLTATAIVLQNQDYDYNTGSYTYTKYIVNAKLRTEPAEVEALPLPSTPANLVAESTGISSIALTWDAAENAATYNVYQGEELIATNLVTTSYAVEGLADDTEYCFTVTAVNLEGESEASEQACATTDDFDGCFVVFTLKDTYGDGWTGNYLEVKYGETTETLGFSVADFNYKEYSKEYVLPLATGTNVTVSFVVPQNGTWPSENGFVVSYQGGEEIINVATGTFVDNNVGTFTYDTFVVNCGNETEEPVEPALPAAPTNVVATADGQNSIIITWDAVEGATDYYVYKDGQMWANTNGATTYTENGLVMGTEYCFAVQTVAGNLESELSEEACATTESLPENQIMVGTATTSYYSPFLTILGGGSWFEAIYKAEEIGKAGRIAEIAFSYSQGNETSADINIYLTEVTKSVFASLADVTPATDLTLVYSGTGVTLCDSAWETFVLDTPFDYSGENNLLLVVTTENTGLANKWNCYTDNNTVLIKDTYLDSKKPVMMLTYAEGGEEPTPTFTHRLESVGTAWGNTAYTFDEENANRVVAIDEDGIVTEVTYNEAGQIASAIASYEDVDEDGNPIEVVISGVEYEYDENGVWTSYTETVQGWFGGTVTSETVLNYDAEGRLVSLASEEYVRTIAYNEAGLISEVVEGYIVVEEEEEGEEEGEEGDDNGISPLSETEIEYSSKITFEYDAEGRLVEKNYYSYDAYETMEFYWGESEVYTYDENGNCVKKEAYEVTEENELKSFPYSVTEYIYDLTINNENVYSFEYPHFAFINYVEPSYANILVKEMSFYSYYDEDVEEVVSHSYEVTAYNYNPAVVLLPLTPMNLTAEVLSATEVELAWAGFPDAESFTLYQGETVIAEGLVDPYYTVENLEMGVEYCFAVMATNSVGNSEVSEIVCVTIELPAAPANLVAEAISDTEIALTWDEVPGIWSYNVYQVVETAEETTYELLGEAWWTEYTVSELAAETEYSFVVKAVSNVGESAASNVATAKTLAPAAPTVPAAPVVTGSFEGDKVILEWEAVEGALAYNLYYGGKLLAGPFEDLIVEIQVPEPGTYCFTVTAVNEVGESEHSEEVCVTVTAPEDMEVPAAPVLEVTLDGNKAILSWEEVENATYYDVYIGSTPEQSQYLGTATMQSLPISLELPEPGEYCFFVVAYNLAGASEPSNVACVNYGEGVEENEASFNIYPNPVSDNLVIETEANIEAVTIYTVTGVVVYNEVEFSNNTINVSDFANGVYIMKVRTENGEAVQRFIKK